MQSSGQMVVASRLSDGRVVFLGTGGEWTGDMQLGALASDKAGAEALLERGREAEAANQVVEAYLITVETLDGQRRATDWRESIRARGPTVRTDLPAPTA